MRALILILAGTCLVLSENQRETDMMKDILPVIAHLQQEFDSIPPPRREQLADIAAYVRAKTGEGDSVRLVFICTHNSRRSHFAQIWAEVAATLYEVAGVRTFSGGISSSAFHPLAVDAVRRAGFRVERPDSGTNPHYRVSFAVAKPPLTAFSKRYDDPENPHSGFAAVMVCSDADEACPFVPGAERRFSLPFDDPKTADGTPAETRAYDERFQQIGREMLYLFSLAR
jgi:protein-tyrosine-phosphatase